MPVNDDLGKRMKEFYEKCGKCLGHFLYGHWEY